jgi:uncharacterized membrane protein
MTGEGPAQAGLGTDRLETLTDGIFAIAMTLLVLNLQVPRIPAALASARLPHELSALWPKILSFVLSFVVVGVYWVGHHNQFHYIRRADRLFMWLNILFLLFIAVVPFSAGLLGTYVRQQIAVAIYGLNLVAVGAVLYLIWSYATADHRLVDPDLPPDAIKAGGRRTLLGVGLYFVAVILSTVSTWLSVAIYVGVPILYILPGRIDRHLLGRRREPRAPPGSSATTRG